MGVKQSYLKYEFSKNKNWFTYSTYNKPSTTINLDKILDIKFINDKRCIIINIDNKQKKKIFFETQTNLSEFYECLIS